MKIGRIVNQFGEEIGTVESDESSGGGGLPRPIVIFFEILFLAFCGFMFFSDAELLDSLPFLRPSLQVTADDMVLSYGTKWMRALWNTGGLSGKLEIIQLAASVIVPCLAGLGLGIKVMIDRVSGLLGLLAGVGIFLGLTAAFALVNSVLDFGFRDFLYNAALYSLTYLLDSFVAAGPIVTLIFIAKAIFPRGLF